MAQGHITGYYKDNGRIIPISVDKDGYLRFRQDSRMSAAISRFAASIESLADYFKKRIAEQQQQGADNEPA